MLGGSLPGGFRGNRILALWTAVFVLVSAQMLTYFRPLLTVSPSGAFRTAHKQFFFEHLHQTLAGTDARVEPQRVERLAGEEEGTTRR
jgi:hypothetical protein